MSPQSPLARVRAGRLGRLTGAAALTTALLGGLLLAPAATASAAGFPDASYLPGSFSGIGCGCAGRLGQSFVVERTGTLAGAQVAANAPAGSDVEFYATDGGGQPTELLGIGTLLGSGNFLSVRSVEVPLLSVTAGQRLAIVVADPSSAAVGYSDAGTYSGGSLIQNFGNGWYVYGRSYDMVFGITVDDGISPTVTAEAGYDLVVGTAFDASIAVTPASASLTVSGSLPAGLVLDGTRLRGTPTAAGTTSVTLVATYGDERVERTVELRVASVPSAVLSLAGVGANGAVDLTWAAPTQLGNAGPLAYGVTATPVGGSAPVFTGSTTALSFRVPQLDNALDYVVAVTPRNTVGAGAGQSVVVAPPAAPSAPTAASVIEDDQQLTVRWAAPATDGGSPVTGYELRTRAAAGAWSTPVAASSPTTLTSLSNGVAVDVEVRALTRSRSGAWASVAGTPRTVPDAATAVVPAAGDGSASLSWTAPASDGGATVESYRVEHRAMGDSEWIAQTSTETSAVVGGLRNGEQYEFRVLAVNEAGAGRASSVVSAIPFTASDAPDLEVIGQADGVISFAWTAPEFDGGRDIVAYRLEHRVVGAEPWTDHAEYAADASSAEVVGLVAGTDYEFRLRAVTEAGAGAPSRAVSARFAVLADAPTELVAVPADGAVELSWTPPVSAGGSAVVRYEVVYHHDGMMHSGDLVAFGTTARVEGLPNGTPVRFWVHAVTVAGVGADATIGSTPFSLDPELVDSAGDVVRALTPGQAFTIVADRLPAGSVATAALHSTPVALGTAAIEADGELALAATVPQSIELGAHEVVVTLEAPGAAPVTVAIPVTVVAAPSAQQVAATDAGVRILASTGGDAAPIGLAALLLLALGGMLLRRTRGAARS